MTNAKNIGLAFLTELDQFIRNNYKSIKCNDIYHLYFDFWNDLKNFRGTATGFTGLSELLVFRYIFHLLGGNFTKKSINKDVSEFTKGNLTIRQGLRVPGPVRYQPDISICESNQINSIIQIKIFLTNGWKTFENELNRLKEFRINNTNNLRALLIVYDTYSISTQLHQKINAAVANVPWFNWVVLKDNNDLFMNVLVKTAKMNNMSD